MGQLELGGWLSGTRLDGRHNPIRDVWAIEGNKVVPGWGDCGGRIYAGRMSNILQVVINPLKPTGKFFCQWRFCVTSP